MESTGIMQQIKGLLEEGSRSGELIQMGFAPGTVYKVQRQFRHQAHMAQKKFSEPQTNRSQEMSSPSSLDGAEMVERLKECQKEKEGLQNEVERLRAAEEVAKISRQQFNTLTGEFDYMKSERLRLDSKITELKDETSRLILRLKEARAENIDLRDYLGSKNCCWQREFLTYKAKRRTYCSLQHRF